MTSEELRGKLKNIHCGMCEMGSRCEGLEEDEVNRILSLLETAMQGVIGEDEKPKPWAVRLNDNQIVRNKLRAEQRSNLLAIVRGERV